MQTQKVRESWVKTLRALIPKAKVELAKEMLMRKAQRKANLELAAQQIREAIESILRDSKRVAVRGGFKTYADALADCFQQLLKAVDLVSEMGLNSAKACAYSISAVVDAANSAAAICSNKAIQDEIVVRTRDIAIETANMLGYATSAAHDANAKNQMFACIESVQEQVQQILELLASFGDFVEMMDRSIEKVENPASKEDIVALASETTVEATVDSIAEKAKILSSVIKNISNNATVTPERVGEYSKETAELMCELLDATNIIAYASGVDPDDPEYIAGASNISEHKRQQLDSLLAAAKGFAAATTNMIDLLKQIPYQTEDENLQFRLSMATRSADNALNAFLMASGRVDGQDQAAAPRSPNPATQLPDFGYGSAYGDSSGSGAVPDAERELLLALDAIEQSVSKLSQSGGARGTVAGGGPGGRGGAGAGRGGGPGGRGGAAAGGGAGGAFPHVNDDGSSPLMSAARKMGEATASLMRAAADAQTSIKETHGGDTYRKDPNWTRGMVSAAQGVADNTAQLVEVAINPNSSPEEIVAAARCVNGATARLVAFNRVKGDPNSPEMVNMENASRNIARAVNRLVDAAKQQKDQELEVSMAGDISRLKEAPRMKQIKSEFEAQARIAKLEAELDAARQYLFQVRKAVYGGADVDDVSSFSSNGKSFSSGGASGGAARRGGASSPSPVSRGGAVSSAPRGGAVGGAPRGGAGGVAPRGGAVAAAPRGGGGVGSPVGAPRGGGVAPRGGPAPRGGVAPRGRGL